MKNLHFVFILIFTLFGITLASAQDHHNVVFEKENASPRKSPKFIEGIEFTPGIQREALVSPQQSTLIESVPSAVVSNVVDKGIEQLSVLQFKYAQLLDLNVEVIKNISLYRFIDEWMDTRYRYGGTSKRGIDCSAFTALLMSTVFGIKVPRVAKDQYSECIKLHNDEILEGDMVFFNTTGGVSHVGLYLDNGYFVHPSRSNGITISNLEDPYYSSRFISGGRVVQKAPFASKKILEKLSF